MIVYHTTLRTRLASIRMNGLDPSRSQGRRKAVWLHTLSQAAWALAHLSVHHGVYVTDLVTIEVAIPRAYLRRALRGIWYTPASVPPSWLGRMFRPGQLVGESEE